VTPASPIATVKRFLKRKKNSLTGCHKAEEATNVKRNRAFRGPQSSTRSSAESSSRLPAACSHSVCKSGGEICSLDVVATDLMPSMSGHIYKKIELVGSSPNGIEDAVNNAIGRASKTIRNMKWFEVAEVRGNIENDKVAHWQVTVKVGFTLDT
jgi:dodecin